MTTRAEQETTIRWDQEEEVAHLTTTYAPESRRWERRGFDVEVTDRDPSNKPRVWTAKVHKDAIRLRRVEGGQVVKRPGHGKGKLFGAEKHDELVATEHQADAG